MAELVHEHSTRIKTAMGATYMARTYANQQRDGTWQGWLEFIPTQGGAVLTTERETTQPTLDMVGYWASGLQPVYLEGGFERAHATSAKRTGG